jgi:dihydroxy-acid dehydratase
MTEAKLNSAALTQGPSRAGARAMLKAVGFTDQDLKRPLIGVANTWIEIGPCNYHLRGLAASVKQGIRSAGGTPMEFNTVSISDGITMGTEGMKMSLVSREVIADSIELVARGNQFDGIVALVGCDKTIPGAIMALARLNIPGLVLYGGSIAPGSYHGHDVTIQDVYEAVGAHAQADERRGFVGDGKQRVSGSGRMRRAVHREHHGDGLRVSRAFSDGECQRACARH